MTAHRIKTRLIVGAACGVWLVTLVLGFAVLNNEATTPVATSRVALQFPAKSALRLAAGKPTLLVFLHPQCPCSRASLHQLNEIVSATQGKLLITAVFTIPKGVPPGWELGDLWNTASTMSNVHVVRDEQGNEAQKFGVIGSGHALLYAASGQLLFSGGITESRGHDGDNPGEAAIISLVLHGRAEIDRSPVFGCSLL